MPSTALRQSVLANAKHLVVKIGTQLLTLPDQQTPGIDSRFVRQLAKQIATLHAQNYRVTLVSSGAIGAGCAELGLAKRPTDVADQQAIAAIGQRRLMTHMHDAFSKHHLGVGQVLLTRSDFDDRARFLNIRNCVNRIHAHGCIPILNENDSVAVDEIRFGDNDLLAALMCNALCADGLILLTVVEGLLDADGQRIDLVENITENLSLARRDKSRWGSGGMMTKLEAARLATDAGEIAVIASGREPNILFKLLNGEKHGTVFMPAKRKMDARQRWIGLTARPAGTVSIDAGAINALTKRGKSLLATGITHITGEFERGDIVLVRDPKGREVARGLTHYTTAELRLIMGKRSNQFEKLLGRPAYAEVIHRDNLVMLQGE